MELSKQLMTDYTPIANTLPEVATGKLLPQEKLPQKFHELGGMYAQPQLILRSDNSSQGEAIILSWGNMRHGIIIYSQPPKVSPEGFFVRQVNERIYVIANES